MKYIYGLTDNGIIFYIGQTLNLEKRLKMHVAESIKLSNKKDRIIQDSLFRGRKIDIIIIRKCINKNALRLEKETIIEFLNKGHNLVNCCHAPKKIFTLKEIKIMQLIANDKTAYQIGKLIYSSNRTVEKIISTIKNKANVNTLGALVYYAYSNMLIK